jgi:hypothetical protein
MIGVGAFSETGHTRCALYLWAHPEVSAVVVEHLIQTRVPMAMNEALKQEVNDLKFQNKSLTEVSEKLESSMGQQGSDTQKLQQNMKDALKK